QQHDGKEVRARRCSEVEIHARPRMRSREVIALDLHASMKCVIDRKAHAAVEIQSHGPSLCIWRGIVKVDGCARLTLPCPAQPAVWKRIFKTAIGNERLALNHQARFARCRYCLIPDTKRVVAVIRVQQDKKEVVSSSQDDWLP